MNIVDIVIVLLLISSVVRGFDVGFVRQASSTLSFIGGLMLSTHLSPLLAARMTHDPQTRSILLVVLTLIISGSLMLIGEWLGLLLKVRLFDGKIMGKIDGIAGSVISIASLGFALWFAVALVALLPNGPITHTIRSSLIYNHVDTHAPPASQLLSSLNTLIDPNSLPQAFSGREPSPSATAALPAVQTFDHALQKAAAATVQIQGLGCGGIVNGSGFVYAKDRVVTNAHVVAGITSPKIATTSGVKDARVVAFDKDNDLAVLASANLGITPLELNTVPLKTGQYGLIVGYPGGGAEQSQVTAVLDIVTALGRDIYGRSKTERNVYVLQAHVIPGNSGGPVLDEEGRVRGVIFATSTSYNNIGYGLTLPQINDQLQHAVTNNTSVSTGACSTM